MKSENFIFFNHIFNNTIKNFCKRTAKKIDYLQDFHLFLTGLPKENPIFIEALDSV